MNSWKHAIFSFFRAGLEPCCAYAPAFYRGFDGAQHPFPVQNHGIGAQNATKIERRAVLKGVSLALGNFVLGIFANEQRDHKNYYGFYHNFNVACS